MNNVNIVKVKINAPEYDMLSTITKKSGGNKPTVELTFWFTEMGIGILIAYQRLCNTTTGEDGVKVFFTSYSEIKGSEQEWVLGEIKNFKPKEVYKSMMGRKIPVEEPTANIIYGLAKELNLPESKVTSLCIEIGKQFNILLYDYIQAPNSLDSQVDKMKSIIENGEYYPVMAQTVERWWLAGQNKD